MLGAPEFLDQAGRGGEYTAGYRCMEGHDAAALPPPPVWPLSTVKSSDCGPSMPRSQHLMLASVAVTQPPSILSFLKIECAIGI